MYENAKGELVGIFAQAGNLVDVDGHWRDLGPPHVAHGGHDVGKFNAALFTYAVLFVQIRRLWADDLGGPWFGLVH